MADTIAYLICGLIVAFGAVGGVVFMIYKKRREDYWNADFDNEGGHKDDHFVVMN